MDRVGSSSGRASGVRRDHREPSPSRPADAAAEEAPAKVFRREESRPPRSASEAPEVRTVSRIASGTPDPADSARSSSSSSRPSPAVPSPRIRPAASGTFRSSPSSSAAKSLATRPAVPALSDAARTPFSIRVRALSCSCSRTEEPVEIMFTGIPLPSREPRALPSEGAAEARAFTAPFRESAARVPRSRITPVMRSVPADPSSDRAEGIAEALSSTDARPDPSGRNREGSRKRSDSPPLPGASRDARREGPGMRFLPVPRRFCVMVFRPFRAELVRLLTRDRPVPARPPVREPAMELPVSPEIRSLAVPAARSARPELTDWISPVVPFSPACARPETAVCVFSARAETRSEPVPASSGTRFETVSLPMAAACAGMLIAPPARSFVIPAAVPMRSEAASAPMRIRSPEIMPPDTVSTKDEARSALPVSRFCVRPAPMSMRSSARTVPVSVMADTGSASSAKAGTANRHTTAQTVSSQRRKCRFTVVMKKSSFEKK